MHTKNPSTANNYDFAVAIHLNSSRPSVLDRTNSNVADAGDDVV